MSATIHANLLISVLPHISQVCRSWKQHLFYFGAQIRIASCVIFDPAVILDLMSSAPTHQLNILNYEYYLLYSWPGH